MTKLYDVKTKTLYNQISRKYDNALKRNNFELTYMYQEQMIFLDKCMKNDEDVVTSDIENTLEYIRRVK